MFTMEKWCKIPISDHSLNNKIGIPSMMGIETSPKILLLLKFPQFSLLAADWKKMIPVYLTAVTYIFPKLTNSH